MDWSKGFEATYYGSFIDENSWRDIERFEILGGSVTHTVSELMESADVSCRNYKGGERWIRIWLDAKQNGETVHTALFTGLANCPKDEIEGNITSNSLECYSVLKPLSDILLPRGWYVSVGSVRGILKDLFEPTPAPIVFDDEMPSLGNYIIAESGETNLSMINRILSALNLRLKITGLGEVHICKTAKDISAEFNAKKDYLEPVLSKENDWYECPNVFRAIADSESVEVRDEENIKERGREIWAEEDSVKLNAQETLYQYALRRLKEKQMVTAKAMYKRRFNPDVYVTDLVKFNYKQINGVYLVNSQKIELGFGATTTEGAIR